VPAVAAPLEAFADLLVDWAQSHSPEVALSQQVLVLKEYVDLFVRGLGDDDGGGDDEDAKYDSGVLFDDIAAFIAALGKQLAAGLTTDEFVLAAYANLLDAFAKAMLRDGGGVDQQGLVPRLQEQVQAMCFAPEAGSIPDGSVTAFDDETTFELLCALAEGQAGLVIDTCETGSGAGIVAVGALNGSTTISIAEWAGTTSNVTVAGSDGALSEC
jgi:hypothetical protein